MDVKKQELIKLLKELDIAMTDTEIEFYVGKLSEADFEKFYQYAGKLRSSFEDLKAEALKKDPVKAKMLIDKYEAEKKNREEKYRQDLAELEAKESGKTLNSQS